MTKTVFFGRKKRDGQQKKKEAKKRTDKKERMYNTDKRVVFSVMKEFKPSAAMHSAAERRRDLVA